MSADREHCNTSRSLLGIARIDLCRLDFKTALNKEHREESRKARARLLKVFQLEGCRRLDPQNYINATISRDTFENALNQTRVTEEQFKDACNLALEDPGCIIKLSLDRTIQCLDGLHRIKAANEFLDNNDKWWIVNLHEESKVQSTFEKHLHESFNHEQRYTDGMIFRNILRYKVSHDERNEKKWWARLSPTKRKNLKQLLSSKNVKLSGAFQKLVDIPGLWPPLQLGTLHRLHGMKCPEIMIGYLGHVHETWLKLVPEVLWCHIDGKSVEMLELLVPGMSRRDGEIIKGAFRDGLIFPSLDDGNARSAILQAIITTKYLIPSLRTFFENQKYLEPGSIILKELLGGVGKRSLWKEYKANYFPITNLPVQCHDQAYAAFYIPAEEITIKAQRKFGYLQLWMFCLRNFPEMTPISPRIEGRCQKNKNDMFSGLQNAPRTQNPALWHKLATFAIKLGFNTDRIREIAQQDPEEMQTTKFLSSVRPNWRGDISKRVSDVKTILKSMSEENTTSLRAPIFSSDKITTWPKDRRCGRPHQQDHEQDKSALFVTLFYHPALPGDDITSLFVKRDMLQAFFPSHIATIESQMDAFIGQFTNGSFQTILQEVPNASANAFSRHTSENEELHRQMQAQKDRHAAQIAKMTADLDQLNLDYEELKSRMNDISQERSGTTQAQLEDLQIKLDASEKLRQIETNKSVNERSEYERRIGQLNQQIITMTDEAKQRTIRSKIDDGLRKKEQVDRLSHRHGIRKLDMATQASLNLDLTTIFREYENWWINHDFIQMMSHEDIGCIHIHVYHGTSTGIFSILVKLNKSIDVIESFLDRIRHSHNFGEGSYALHLILSGGSDKSSLIYRVLPFESLNASNFAKACDRGTAIFYGDRGYFPNIFKLYSDHYHTLTKFTGAGRKRRGNLLESSLQSRIRMNQWRPPLEDEGEAQDEEEEL